MTNLKFKKGDILVTTQTSFQPHQQEVTVLETNPSKTQSAYRTSDEPNYWWHRDTVEDNYALKEGVPKFKVGDKLIADRPDWSEAVRNVEVLEVNPNSEGDMYRTSDAPLNWWCRAVV